MVIRFKASEAGRQNLVFSYLPNPVSTGKYIRKQKGEFCYSARLDNNKMEYAVRVKAVTEGGKSWTDGNCFGRYGLSDEL